MTLEPGVKVTRLSPQQGGFFFGYYDKSPYDQAGDVVLAGQADFISRMPKEGEALRIGLLDAAGARRGTQKFRQLAETTAWCWQQGAMLQWLPPQFQQSIIFNVIREGRLNSCILEVESKRQRFLSRPIYAVDPQGRYALSLNFSRLARTRPGYGYEGVEDPTIGVDRPGDDGVWQVPLDAAEPRLIFSLADAASLKAWPEMEQTEHWFNHLQINPSGNRTAVLHRWRAGRADWRTRLLTMNPDGSDPYVLADSGFFSHYDWVDDRTIVGWTDHGHNEMAYTLLTDRSSTLAALRDTALYCDGHMSLSPDRTCMLSDTYPDSQSMRNLFLWKWPGGPAQRLGQFFSPPDLEGPVRVDLHPRWKRDGKAICIDSAHEGARHLYEVTFE